MNLYSEAILEHSKYPSNYGTLEDASVSHEEHNPLCGDRIRIELHIEHDTIQAIKFSGEGCAISQAAASMLTEAIAGKSLQEAKSFSKDDLLALIGIPLDKNPMRLKCALLALKAFKMGLYGVGTTLDDEDL
ncbi:MAG: SUF system NifU family Fe-S cluster assembly protein [Deltaproteobacteria bacterium]|nr:SUF system NifU family Fe-S cluster assembly protein [Deltaproteobacteria bacterium]